LIAAAASPACASVGFASAPNYGPLPRNPEQALAGACPIVASYGARDRGLRGAATQLDGLRPYRVGAPASRIHWPALARGAGLIERRLRADGDARPLIVLDARLPGAGPGTQLLDAAVRAAASLTLALARSGGCGLLLPGEQRPTPIDAELTAWPAAYARLAVVDGAGARAPALGPSTGRIGPLVYVAVRAPDRLGAMSAAGEKGGLTMGIVCNANTPLEQEVDILIAPLVGPEVIAGSTRLKAGTAQKMVLNMLTTGTMTRLGHVYGNLMVNVHLKNQKLRERGVAILERAAGVTRTEAQQALRDSGDQLPVGLVMLLSGATRAQAQSGLKSAGGNVRKALKGFRKN